MTIDECKIIELPKISDPRGNLTFIEGDRNIPFAIRRAYWIYDVPGGEIRGGHSYRTLQELIIAVSGSFDVVVDDGNNKRVFSLNRSYYGLYVPSMIWRDLENFSTNSLCFVLSSSDYEESDYIRDFSAYRQLVEGC